MAKFQLMTLILFLSMVSTNAVGQSLQIERFEPLGTPSSTLNIHNSRIDIHNAAQLTLFTHYSDSLFVLSTDEKVFFRPIQSRLTSEIAGSISLFQNVELSFVLPLIFQSGDAQGQTPSDTLDRSGAFLGDLRFTPKISFLNSGLHSGVGLGVALPIYLPLARSPSLGGNEELRVEPKIFVDYTTVKSLNFAFNIGFQKHEMRQLQGYQQSKRMRLGLSADLPLSKTFALSSVVFSDLSLDKKRNALGALEDEFQTPSLEALASIGVKFSPQISANLGGGLGLTSAPGVPLFRTFLSLSIRAADADKDNDGVLDSVDECPDTPEDADFFEDADGCPEADNDKDGIPDLEDACTNEAEDFDNFVDTDGCPDPDNDQDGILDEEDSCPSQAGLLVNKGCPQDLGKMGGDNPSISSKIKNARSRIRECELKLLKEDPKAKGKLTIRWTINNEGKVVATKIVENTLDPVFGMCISDLLQGMKFDTKHEATVERRFIIDSHQ